MRPHSSSSVQLSRMYYISGYLARKVTVSKLCAQSIKSACTSDGSHDDLGFISKYSAWTATVTRGGLVTPSQTFYLMVRSMDRVHCQNVNLKFMTSDSLNRCMLTEAMLNDITVKHHWNTIMKCSGADERSALRLLEYIIRIFATVKC